MIFFIITHNSNISLSFFHHHALPQPLCPEGLTDLLVPKYYYISVKRNRISIKNFALNIFNIFRFKSQDLPQSECLTDKLNTPKNEMDFQTILIKTKSGRNYPFAPATPSLFIQNQFLKNNVPSLAPCKKHWFCYLGWSKVKLESRQHFNTSFTQNSFEFPKYFSIWICNIPSKKNKESHWLQFMWDLQQLTSRKNSLHLSALVIQYK